MRKKRLYWSDIIPIIGLVLWFWGSEIIKKYAEQTWLSPVIEWMDVNFQFSVPFWSVFFFCGIFVSIFVRIYNRRVSELEEQLEDEKRIMALLSEEQRPLQMRYLLSKAAQAFVERNAYAIAAQLFHYEIMIGRGTTRIMVKNIGEYAREGENVNIFAQHYYYVPTKLYRELQDAQKQWSSGNIMPTIYLANGLKSRLKSKAIHKYKERDAVEFAFYRIALGMWGTHIGTEIDLDLDDDVVEKLESLLRSGILMAILMNMTFYVFSNHGIDGKRDRVYYATEIQTPRDKLLALIIFSPSLLDEASSSIESTMTHADQVLRDLLRKVYYNNANT